MTRLKARLKVGILISGSGSNMVALLDSMTADHPARPVIVLSDTDKAPGLERAAEHGIKAVAINRALYGQDRAAFEAAVLDTLKSAGADMLCLAGFMRVLSADFIAQWPQGILNIHPSLLPKFKGLHTHARAIEAGDSAHGCTVHEVTAALDGGPVLGQARLQIDPKDTSETLAARVLEWEHRLYPAVLRRFATGDKTPLFLP